MKARDEEIRKEFLSSHSAETPRKVYVKGVEKTTTLEFRREKRERKERPSRGDSRWKEDSKGRIKNRRQILDWKGGGRKGLVKAVGMSGHYSFNRGRNECGRGRGLNME